jgi:hypothetical protein
MSLELAFQARPEREVRSHILRGSGSRLFLQLSDSFFERLGIAVSIWK